MEHTSARDEQARPSAPQAPNPDQTLEEFAKRREAALMAADYHGAELSKAKRVATALSQAMEHLQMGVPEPDEDMPSAPPYRDRHG